MTSLDWENDDEDWGSETEDKWDVVVNGANDFECDDEPKDKQPYLCISQKDATQNQQQRIEELAELMGDSDPYDEARLLLINNKWNKDRAFRAFTENPDRARLDSGISPNLPVPIDSNIDLEVECQMCLEDFPSNQMGALACGHKFCANCWEDYLKESAKTRTSCIRCPAKNCTYAITPGRLNRLPISKATIEFFEIRTDRFQLQSFIDQSEGFIPCTGKGCDKIFQVFDVDCKEVKCSCKKEFCPSCREDVHRPCPCDIAFKWIEKNNSESENLHWIIAKTKRCPKCRAPIEKTQGCNHMTCRNPACSYEFCWLCLGPWSEHGSSTGGFYKCNIYETKKKSGDLDEADKARGDAENEIERYTFYFERYENHQKAIDALMNTMDQTELRMSELMSEFQWTPDQTNFLREAADAITASRRLLMWTYPVGYFMSEDFYMRELFHQYQKDLEMYTEHLHELMDQSLETFKDPAKKEEVINHQRQVAKYTKNLLVGIETEINPKAFGQGMDLN